MSRRPIEIRVWPNRDILRCAQDTKVLLVVLTSPNEQAPTDMADDRSAAAFVLEGQLHLGAIGRDLAILDDDILLDDLGNAQVAQ